MQTDDMKNEGYSIENACEIGVIIAQEQQEDVSFVYDGISVIAGPRDNPSVLVERWRHEKQTSRPTMPVC
jgi:hypothetical protein